jgi:3'-5' exoribonuclease
MKVIKEFIANEDVSTYFLIKSIEIKQTRTTPPKDYFDLVLVDQTGEITAKMWDIGSLDKESFASMQVVFAKGNVHLYRDKLQFKVEQLRKATEQDGVSISQFIRMSPIPPQQLFDTIKQTTLSIQEPMIRDIVQFCLNRSAEKLLSYPAAKSIHHAFLGGLAYHMVRMLEIAEFLIKTRPFLQADLLRAGIILHDIAKTEELEAVQGVVSDYSLTGKLIGHISLASNWVVEAAITLQVPLSDPRVIALQHMILAHHNKGEYGSPVQPQLPEAVALHYIDLVDSRLQAVEDAMQSLSPQTAWTPPIKAVENMAMYKMTWE